MAENFQNFYVTKLREACDAVATTIYVDTVPAITEGTLVIEYANSTKHEIIHFTGVSGYGLTGCTRGMEGTTAQSHSAGVDVRQNLTAGMIDKIINGVITTENIADSAVTTAKINNGAVTADKIDFTTLDRGWVDLTPQKGTWTKLAYRLVNKYCYIYGYASSITFADGQITTLPQEIRPTQTPEVHCFADGSGGRKGRILISSTDGSVNMGAFDNSSGNGYMTFNTNFYID